MCIVYRHNLLKHRASKRLWPLSPVEISGSEMCKHLTKTLVWRDWSPLGVRTRTVTCLIPKCYCITTTSPEQAVGALCRMWDVLCYVVLCCGGGTHWGISTAQLTRQPVPVGLTRSPAHRHGTLEVLIFCFGHRKAFHRTATLVLEPGRRKAFLPRSTWARW